MYGGVGVGANKLSSRRINTPALLPSYLSVSVNDFSKFYNCFTFYRARACVCLSVYVQFLLKFIKSTSSSYSPASATAVYRINFYFRSWVLTSRTNIKLQHLVSVEPRRYTVIHMHVEFAQLKRLSLASSYENFFKAHEKVNISLKCQLVTFWARVHPAKRDFHSGLIT